MVAKNMKRSSKKSIVMSEKEAKAVVTAMAMAIEYAGEPPRSIGKHIDSVAQRIMDEFGLAFSTCEDCGGIVG